MLQQRDDDTYGAGNAGYGCPISQSQSIHGGTSRLMFASRRMVEFARIIFLLRFS